MQKPNKSGGEFEELIAWIQKSVHQRAEIRADEKLQDRDTGGLRQVDITIRLSDGPTNFLGIVEVRDRSRPIGVEYVEEVSGKLRSLRANAAFLVSRSGFTKKAIEKAPKLDVDIRLLTYAEARKADWSSWLWCRTFTCFHKKCDSPSVAFLEYSTDKIIDIHTKYMVEFGKDRNAALVLNEQGMALLSIPDLTNRVISEFGDRPFEHIPRDGSRVKHTLLFKCELEPSLWLLSNDNTLRRIGKIRIEAEFYWESQESPVTLSRYQDAASRKSIAELAATEAEIAGQRYRLELLVPGAGEYVPKGSEIRARVIPLRDNSLQKDMK